MFFILFFLAAILISLKHFQNRSIIIKLNEILLPITIVFLTVSLIIFSKENLLAARMALYTCLNIIIPSLFPFFVFTRILLETGSAKKIGDLLNPLMMPVFRLPGCASFPLVMGMVGGYPAGAKITADLYKKKLITKLDAERLLACSNNSGPLFIVGALGIGMLGSKEFGLILLATHIAASLSIAFALRFCYRKDNISYIPNKINTLKYKKALTPELLGNAISDSTMTLLQISGYIIFFSVIINILESYTILNIPSFIRNSKDILSSISKGLIEITTGLKNLSTSNSISIQTKLVISAFICGWAGASVHFQVISFLKGTPIRVKLYLLSKLVHGSLSAIYTFIFIKVQRLNITVSTGEKLSKNTALKYSVIPMALVIILYTVFNIIATKTKRKSILAPRD